MHKKLTVIIVILLAVVTPSVSSAQAAVSDIVKVQGAFSTDHLRQGGKFELALALDIKKGFHTNANTPTADFPTTVTLDPSPGIRFGKPEYPAPLMKFFEFASAKLPVYEGRVVVVVPGKVDRGTALGTRVITGRVDYQSCNDTSCYPPAAVRFGIRTAVAGADANVKWVNQALFGSKRASGSRPLDEQTGELVGKIEKYGIPFVFLAGLVLCLSPCVFPMIPVIVGYFGSQGQGRKAHVSVLAALFVFGLATTYSVMGTTAALAGRGLGSVMQHPAVPAFLAGILVVLALSLFGLYEIPLPSFIANRSQARSGAFGALVMGLVFGLVAAPCVGPGVVALLAVVGKMGNPLRGFLMFFALSLGLGTPFFFLALFSGALARVPRPGNWMMAVRKLFGFLLLGAALYYVRQLLPQPAARLAIPMFMVAAGVYWMLLDRSTRRMPIIRPVQQFLGAAAILFGAWSVFASSAPSIIWTPYTQQAVQAAREAEQPVLIDFTAAWCPPCEELERTTFADPAVRKESDRFVRLAVDLSRKSAASDKIAARYRVPGPPTIVFIDSRGNESDRILGYVNPGDFLKRLRRVR